MRKFKSMMKIKKQLSLYFKLVVLTHVSIFLPVSIAFAEEMHPIDRVNQTIKLSQNSSYIGLRLGGQYGTDNLPSGLTAVTGWAIVDGDREISDYALDEIYSIAVFLEGQELKVFLNQRIGGTDDENAEYQVIDVLNIAEPKFQDVSVAKSALKGLVCFQGEDLENLDSEIIALVNPENTSFIISDIKQAWRANRDTGKIESISSENIGCGNFGSFGF
ncbi:MAG: hypothetical protein AAGE96_13075 [Cyanobacteria bacterium P01_G01_bin.19]